MIPARVRVATMAGASSILPVLLLVLGGCSSEEATQPALQLAPGQVGGQVTRDGSAYVGATIRLIPTSGVEVTTVTGASGYRFFNVPVGPARVRIDVPAGLVLVTPDSIEKSVTVPSGTGVLGPFFVLGNPAVPTGKLEASTDFGGSPLAGVGVTVVDASAGSQSGMTDASGHVSLAGLAVGDATVTVTAPAGHVPLDPPGATQMVRIGPDSTSTLLFGFTLGGSLPPGTPLNDSPQNLMIRFERAYEYQVAAEYEPLFTADFVFHFSSQSDPDLVTQWGTNWAAKQESQSARHLFDGFRNTLGDSTEGATRIDMVLNAPTFGDHPAFPPDSLEYYEWVVVPRLVLEIEVPSLPDPLVFVVDARHEFFLVRGDVARLREGQEPRSDRWYIYRWDDVSAPVFSPANSVWRRSMPSTPVTWGRIKSLYYE